MDILRLISLLLDYPEQTLDGELPALSAVIDDSPLSSDARRGLWRFIQARQGLDLLDLQADYEEVFGRGRAHSLWLFEHVHGESRDRGQAMVDLLDNYRRAGLELAHNELPDYLPLFLEFLATQGEDNARAWLQDVAYILALVQCRLEKIGSDFAAPLAALVELAGTRLDLGEVRHRVADEARDDTPEALDQAWEEEEILFGSAGGGCDSATDNRKPEPAVPLHWVDFSTTPDGAQGAVPSKRL